MATADKDRYLASLFAPDARRPYLLALYAFNIELARVRETVREPMLGELRLQWWRDALDGMYAGDTPEHPVAQALVRTVEIGDIPKHTLMNMIEARLFDLYDDPMPTLNDLEGYLGETASALVQMGAMVLAGPDALAGAEAAGLAGAAFGLTGLLRSLPLHRARGQCYLPAEMLTRRDLTPAHVLSGRDELALGTVLAELRHRAAELLHQARERTWTVPRAALPAFLHVCLTDGYLRRLHRLGPRALTTVAEVSQMRRQWRLFWQGQFEHF